MVFPTIYALRCDLPPAMPIAGFEPIELSACGLRFLEHIGDSAKFAGSLVDKFTDFSQMGRAVLRFSNVEMTALVQRFVAKCC